MAERTQDGEPPSSVEDAWIDGWDFTVVFDDALAGGLDEELDELVANLAAAGGIREVIHEDRHQGSHPRRQRGSTSRSTTSTHASAVEQKVAGAVEQAGLRYV